MSIFETTISIVAPIMGLLLVAATSYVHELTGDVVFENKTTLRWLSALFLLSFVGGGGLLLLAIWRLVSEAYMRGSLSLWIIISLITGILLTSRLIKQLTQNEGIPEEEEADPIPVDEDSDPNTRNQ